MKPLTDFFFEGNLFWKIVLFFWALLTSLFSNAQESKNSEIYKVLKSKDSIIFERTFNRCELEKLDDIINDDFEFYHDVAGETSKEQFIQSVKNNICSNDNRKPIRKLVDETLEVYALKNEGKLYGAIQRGKHLFFIKENNKLTPTGSALFTHLWILKNNSWNLKLVLSYNHLPVQH
ncbi:uncharacterized protein DUF4440 [Tenacibaculum skagerrakense]|uniref:Uncharacterized protein DUF4440 n=1 Tax=Tenacibaculum skagerrakense TaxID=186571 RepID=A0A4V2SMC8_9FLAO|nr:nuclear transport factor 2 family protein [Tenacibaculum skagerrakense]TCP26776.1 uncharacterized protein DUF4440 [Tenacibaculum skagerrakense]